MRVTTDGRVGQPSTRSPMPQLRDGEQRVAAAQASIPRVLSANINPGYVNHTRYMRGETSTSFGYDLQTAVRPDKSHNLKVRPPASVLVAPRDQPTGRACTSRWRRIAHDHSQDAPDLQSIDHPFCIQRDGLKDFVERALQLHDGEICRIRAL